MSLARQDPLRCYQHTEEEPHVSCFKVPANCPVCKANLAKTAFSVPPFCLPSPFLNATKETHHPQKKYKCMVLLKPTCGDFLL